MDSVDQPTATPTRKVATAGISGAIVAIIFWLVGLVSDVEIPPEVAAAVTTIVAFALSYLVPERA